VLDVRQSRELQAALLALKQAERSIRSNINKRTRAELAPLWQQTLTGKASTLVDRRALLPGARVTVSDRGIRAIAAGSRKPLSGGLIPSIDYGPLEWGSNVKPSKVQARSPRGKAYGYTRKTGRQFRPWTRQGHVVMHAAGDVIAKSVAIWVRTIVDEFRGEFDVKQGR
jgi:hypothetical protein